MNQCIAVSHLDEVNVPSRYESHNFEGYVEDNVGQLNPEPMHSNLIETNIVMNSNRPSSSSSLSQNVQSEYHESSAELEKKEDTSFSRSQSTTRPSQSYESSDDHNLSEGISDIREAEGYNNIIHEDQYSVHSNKQSSSESFIDLPHGTVLTQAGNQGQTSVLHLNSVDSVSVYDDSICTSDDFVPVTKLREGENLRGRRNSGIMCVNVLSQYQSHSIDETADLNQYFQGESNIDYYQQSKGFETQSTYLNYQIETTTGTSEQFQQQEPQLPMQRLHFHHEPVSDEVYKQHQYVQKQQHLAADWVIGSESVSKFDQQSNEQSYHEYEPQFYNYHHQQQTHCLPVHSGVHLIDNQHRSPLVNSHPTSDYQVQQEPYALARFHRYEQRGDVSATSEKIWLSKRQHQEQVSETQVNEFEPAQHSQEILTYSEVPETIQYINQTRNITSSFSLHETTLVDHNNNDNLSSKSNMNRVSVLFEANTSYDHQSQCFSNVAKYDHGGELIEYRPMDTVDPALLLTSDCSGGMIIPQTHTTYGPTLNNATYHSYETSYEYQHNEIPNGNGQYLNESATYLDLDESGKTYHLMCQSNANLAQNGISSPFEATDSTTQNPSCSSNKLETQKPSSLTCYALPEHDGQSLASDNDVPRVSQTYDPNLEISTVLFDNEESTSSHDEETSWSETPTKYSSTANKSRSKGTSLSPVKIPRCSQETLQKLRAFLDRRKIIRKSNDSSRFSSFSGGAGVTSQRLNVSKFSQSQSSNSICDKTVLMDNRLETEPSSGIEATVQRCRSSHISSTDRVNENDTSNCESNSSSGDEFKSSSLNSSPVSSIFNGSIDETSNHRSLSKKESSTLIGDGKMKDPFKHKNTDDAPHLINTENRQLRNRTIIIAPKTVQQTNSDYRHSDSNLRSKRRRLNRSQDFYDNSSSEPTSGSLR